MARPLAMETIWRNRENNKARLFHLRREVELGHSRTGEESLFFLLRLCSFRAALQKAICPENKRKCSDAKKMRERLNKKIGEINKNNAAGKSNFTQVKVSYGHAKASRRDRDGASRSLLILPGTQTHSAGR